MSRLLALTLAVSAALATPALAQESAEAASAIEIVLAESFRDDDRARDRWRHPAETLAFFRVEPTMTVAEYSPGGGWYTRVLAPLVGRQGRYLAVNPDSAAEQMNAERRARADAWPTDFAGRVEGWTGLPAARVTAFESDTPPAGVAGTVDRVLIIRNMHSIINDGNVSTELRNLRRLLSDDGLVGVVQHRAPEDDSYPQADGERGYLKQSDIIALFDAFGFALVEASEINANPADTADWPRGVWTLPPTYTLGDVDRARYEAIGESDRMTLLFRKAE
ncbi:MAG: class I SAM-dependent methyltransferase [Sphingomonadaceae bacterium]|nr:class I SAM-dependent methyltransferase [Sphingomonadaceae bacterium]